MKHLSVIASALLLFGAACGSPSESASGSGAVGVNATTTTSEAVATTAATTAAEAVEAERLEIGGPVEPGRYQTDLMGTTMEFDLDETWIPVAGDPGGMVLEHPEKVGAFSEAILITRMSSFGGPTDVDVEPEGLFLSGAPDDLDGWLNASGELLVDLDEQTQVGDVAARVVQVRVDPDGTRTIPGGCGPEADDRCFFVGGTSGEALRFYIVRTTEIYRMWFIPQAGFAEPVLIVAIAAEGNEEFLDLAGELVETISFGTPGAHPVKPPEGPLWEAGISARVPAGNVMIPAIGGLSFEMTEDRFIFQDQNFVSIEANFETESPFSPSMSIALATKMQVGDAVAGTADLVKVFGSAGTLSESGDEVEVLGLTLAGYDFSFTGPPSPEQAVSAAAPGGDSNSAWFPGDQARLYMADYPDGGVLVISYDGFTPDELGEARKVFQDIVPTLTQG